MDLKVIDLFCGAGGGSLGFKQAGFEIVGALDNDAAACQTYRYNFGLAPLQTDIRKVTPREFLRHYRLRRGDVTALIGCPPCQGFSRARTYYSADPRNATVRIFSDWVQTILPAVVVFENVPGMLNRSRRRFDKLIRCLEHSGYEAAWKVLDAADYGVPQRRKRLVVIASRRAIINSPPSFPNPSKDCRTVRQAIADLPRLRAGQAIPEIPNHRARGIAGNTLRLVQLVPPNGGSRADVWRRYWLQCHKDHDGHEDVFGRMRWDDVAPTLTCGCTDPSKGRFVHPNQHRGITGREAARLQSFPDSHVFFSALEEENQERLRPENYLLFSNLKDVERLIGNSFPPLLMRKIAKSIRKRL